MREIGKIFRFEAAHFLPKHNGVCQHLHGHSYKLEVRVSGKVNIDRERSDFGMIMDFKDLKNIIKDVVMDTHDHAYLNDIYPNPTAEIMVRVIALAIKEEINLIYSTSSPIELRMVKLWETEDSYAIWRAND